MLDNINSDNAAELAAAAMVAGGYFGRPYLDNFRNATADNPSPNPARKQIKPFLKAMEERIQEFEPGYKADEKMMVVPSQSGVNLLGLSDHASKASNSRLTKANKAHYGVDNIVSINPYHDDASLAHELGHTVTQRTPIGNQIHKAKTLMRSGKNNAKNITTIATLLAPALASYMQEGDDDFATALGLGLAINAPTLMDEAFATGEGFNLMNRAGKPGTLGQKARMAGSFLTYTMAPVISAAIGSTAGNVLEETI